MTDLPAASWAAIGIAAWLFALPCASAGSEQTQSTPVPKSWLADFAKPLIVDVRHENLQPGCRQHAGELTQSIIDELLNHGASLSFSRSYVEAELKYLRAHLQTNSATQTVEGLGKSLETALRSGRFDWQRLRELHVRAPDSETVASHLPWLSSRSDIHSVRLAEDDPASTSVPTLELVFTWSSIPMRGVVSTSDRGLNNRVYTGKGLAWKFGAQLRLHQQGTNYFIRSYPAPAWVERYETVDSRPLFVMTRALLQDIKTGMTALPATPPRKERRK